MNKVGVSEVMITLPVLPESMGVGIHASIHNHFNQERHLYCRQNFKDNRSAVLAEWRQIAA
jgi:hypothetical protein